MRRSVVFLFSSYVVFSILFIMSESFRRFIHQQTYDRRSRSSIEKLKSEFGKNSRLPFILPEISARETIGRRVINSGVRISEMIVFLLTAKIARADTNSGKSSYGC